ncbi:hypothetical protein ACFWP2_10085 [Kitasatospora sp. NPDC058444]|uniref:hypothetical protein n=1 Tax=Kitasatospora sp. NPDC058444 TaxID=3346504 RepID=UPI003654A7A9
MPSRIPGRRRAGLAGFAGLVLTVGLALTGCDPSAADGGATASASARPTVAATSTTAAATSPPATPAAPAPAPVTTPPAPPAPAAPVATPPPVAPPAQPSAPAQPPVTKAPQPKVTTAQPPTDPEPPAAAGAGCEIRSNAGNCYEAGQFCRNADLGKSTHDAGGRVIYCRMVSGKPHWQA